MKEVTRKAVVTWLTAIAKILSYFAAAFGGGLVASGCKQFALVGIAP